MKDYSNYHKRDIKVKIKKDAEFIFNHTMDGYASQNVTINGVPNIKVLLYQKWDADGEAYKIVGYPNDIERGNQIIHDGENWLITSKPEDNNIYKKATMQLCTAAFPVIIQGQEIIIGYDKLGRPIPESTPSITENIPCVIKMNDASTAIADTNEAVNLLANQVTVTIPYREADSIAYNEQFQLYNDIYRIIRINPSDSINKVGILHITGERVENVGGDSQ